MLRKIYQSVLLCAAACPVLAQQNRFTHYEELPDPKPINQASWEAVNGTGMHAAFGSADIRYAKGNAPDAASVSAQWQTKAWKGEQVHTQLLIWSTSPLQQVSITTAPLRDEKGHTIPAKQISAGFVRYVMTDELNKDGTGCGYRKSVDFDSSLAADAIDIITSRDIPANTTQPVWLNVSVPAGTAAGNYRGELSINTTTGGKTIRLPYSIRVVNHVLPAPKDWKFYLDLWQSPYAVSRMYQVKPWSTEHFAAMKPYMQMLADAGQKVITASIIYDPWSGQTEDVYGSMIRWIKKTDGQWIYDYTVFDKWVQFMLDLGINKEVNCYSMIPWNLKFYYYDEALGKDSFVTAKPGTPEYNAHWKPMLTDFVKHLKAKGWFGITAIAMDERSMEDMQHTLALIKSVEKDFKVSLAGNYHAQIANELTDMCIASAEEKKMPATVIAERRSKGLTTTFYTYCHEGYPNTFTFSPPAEAAWLGWHAALKGYDGYLRWAYNSWVKDPLRDSRFRSWAAGDTYFVYPGVRSSIRFERLKEGIQDYEKIRLLRDEFTRTNNKEKLQQLDALLAPFELDALKTTSAAAMINQAREALNAL